MEDAEIFSLFLVGRQDEEATDLKPYGWINQREKKSSNGFPELAILHGKVNYNQKSNEMRRVMVEKRKRKMTLATEQIVIKISQNLLLPRMHYSLSSISRQFIISYLEYSPNLNWWRGDVEKDLGKGLHREDWEGTMEICDETYLAVPGRAISHSWWRWFHSWWRWFDSW